MSVILWKYTDGLIGGRPEYTPSGTSPGVCDPGPKPQPKFTAVVNGPVSRGVLEGSLKATSFAGGPFDFISEAPLRPKTVYVSDHRTTTRRPMSSFRALQKDGRIVVSPMHAEKIEYTLFPGGEGLETPFSRDSRTAISAPGTLIPAEVNPCNGYTEPGYGIYTAFDGVPLDSPFRGPPNSTLAAARSYDGYIITRQALAPELPVKEAIGQILAELNKPWNQNLITAASAEANSGIVDLLTEIGEAKETLGYIMGLLRSIVELVVKTKRDISKAIRNKRPGQAFESIADEVASIWMQFRYAVSPLGYSINDALDYMQSSFSPYQTFRSGDSNNFTPVLSNGWMPSGSIEIIDRVWLKYRFESEDLLHDLKFNPAATAWELIPLSFVVDWVLNIGDLISSLSTPSAVTQIGAQYSRQIRRGSKMLIYKPNSSYGHIELNFAYYNARPYNPLDHVGLTINPSMTWKRWLDALALSWLTTKNMLK